MYRVIFFLFIVFFTGCRPSEVPSGSKPVVTPPQYSAVDISATLLALPPGPSIESSRIVLQAFFDSYDRHDVTGVLNTLAEAFAYGDCDFTGHQMFVFETKDALTDWLQARFVEGDQFRVDEMIIAPAEGSPANDPRSTAVQVSRTNENLVQEKQSLFKIILNTDGNRIQYLNTYGNVDCEAGR